MIPREKVYRLLGSSAFLYTHRISHNLISLLPTHVIENGKVKCFPVTKVRAGRLWTSKPQHFCYIAYWTIFQFLNDEWDYSSMTLLYYEHNIKILRDLTTFCLEVFVFIRNQEIANPAEAFTCENKENHSSLPFSMKGWNQWGIRQLPSWKI